MLPAGLQGAPASPYNVPIGPHRRFAWVDGDLTQFKAIKSALGGTVNDIVLSVVAGALRSHMQANGHEVDGIELKAMVPMSVRAEAERGALGNRVTAMYAPLPVYAADPVERFEAVHEAMKGLKESGQAVGAEAITQLAGFAPPTVLSQASRLQSAQRVFNVVVTNVPGPQFPLYILGRRLLRIYPQVPLVTNTALGIAIMSYDGTLNFGLLERLRRAAGPRRPRRRAARRDRRARGRRRGPARQRPRAARHGRPRARGARRMRRVLGGLLAIVDRPRRGGRRMLLLQSRDDAGVEKAAGPGERVAARCPDATRPPSRVTRRPLTRDQLQPALALGNVVLRYGGAAARRAASLQDQLAALRRGNRGRRPSRDPRPGAPPGSRRSPGAGGYGRPVDRAARVRRGVVGRGRAEALLARGLASLGSLGNRLAALRRGLGRRLRGRGQSLDRLARGLLGLVRARVASVSCRVAAPLWPAASRSPWSAVPFAAPFAGSPFLVFPERLRAPPRSSGRARTGAPRRR